MGVLGSVGIFGVILLIAVLLIIVVNTVLTIITGHKVHLVAAATNVIHKNTFSAFPGNISHFGTIPPSDFGAGNTGTFAIRNQVLGEGGLMGLGQNQFNDMNSINPNSVPNTMVISASDGKSDGSDPYSVYGYGSDYAQNGAMGGTIANEAM